MIDEEGYILKEVWGVKRIKIPDGCIRCPECQGSGQVVRIYKDPGPNEYMTCLTCCGNGYVCKCNNPANKKSICFPINCPRNYRSFFDFAEHCVDNATNNSNKTEVGKE